MNHCSTLMTQRENQTHQWAGSIFAWWCNWKRLNSQTTVATFPRIHLMVFSPKHHLKPQVSSCCQRGGTSLTYLLLSLCGSAAGSLYYWFCLGDLLYTPAVTFSLFYLWLIKLFYEHFAILISATMYTTTNAVVGLFSFSPKYTYDINK